ncbi:MAG TPA: SpoIIE family protein phosphatase [Acidimicrobiales bacterium]|jgi:serine phosphatase RsbU (regulator of sigma subunit)/anti-sigma regulatory factor (Ser/Thr protein kinase)|nr:SpoIIE family protein phosphatase [Acidimicrobiales bacterium]
MPQIAMRVARLVRRDSASRPSPPDSTGTGVGEVPTVSGGDPGTPEGLNGHVPATGDEGAQRAPGDSRVSLDIDIAPNDPIVRYFQEAPGAVELSTLRLFTSPALDAMRAAGVVLAVPLVVTGELIGLVLLGPRLSERAYSVDDRRLLDSLASYAAPALRMGQLAEEQKAEALRRERIEQELLVAQLIQQQFLPKSLPDLPGWALTAFYRPARTVGGDFYDCIELPGGRAMIVVGDVTDKGVPAALVMASTHSLLRAAAPRLRSPGATLAQVNDMLCGDIPAHMFVTCFALVLDPMNGRIEFANAGHDLPYLRTATGVVELRATGMPLGLMPGMVYEEATVQLNAGEQILLHSDGLAEAHDESRQMFGFPRVAELAGRPARGEELIDLCLSELERFSGAGHEQEDDITLVTVECTKSEAPNSEGDTLQELARFEVPSEEGNERLAMAKVASAVADIEMTQDRLERLKTAVAETTMNAIEHGNEGRAEVPVELTVLRGPSTIVVTVTDSGGARAAPAIAETPDLTAKLAGLQRPRGWGLFLIEHMVDHVEDTTEGERHTVRLTVHLQAADSTRDYGGSDGRDA